MIGYEMFESSKSVTNELIDPRNVIIDKIEKFWKDKMIEMISRISTILISFLRIIIEY